MLTAVAALCALAGATVLITVAAAFLAGAACWLCDQTCRIIARVCASAAWQWICKVCKGLDWGLRKVVGPAVELAANHLWLFIAAIFFAWVVANGIWVKVRIEQIEQENRERRERRDSQVEQGYQKIKKGMTVLEVCKIIGRGPDDSMGDGSVVWWLYKRKCFKVSVEHAPDVHPSEKRVTGMKMFTFKPGDDELKIVNETPVD